jgi:hypothetical protein
MSADQESFEQLRRLLALKRYEQPHPKYFNDFSQQVIARLRDGERVEDTALENVFWLQRLWSLFETKPVFAGAFGAFACAVLVGGCIYSESADLSQSAAATAAISLTQNSPQAPTTSVTPNAQVPLDAALVQGQAIPSTDGIIPPQPRGSLFDQVGRLQPQLVTFPSASSQ